MKLTSELIVTPNASTEKNAATLNGSSRISFRTYSFKLSDTSVSRAFLFVHRVLSYPILPLPQHIRYYFSKRELGVANTIIVCCSNTEKYDLLFGERLDLRSSSIG